jgi:hypothetical protein
MKVINAIVTVLTILLVTQSFLTACPTCLNELQKNKDHNLVGEMESQISKKAQDLNDRQKKNLLTATNDQTTQDGFTAYDKAILAKVKK